MRTVKPIQRLARICVQRHSYLLSRRELPVTVTVRKPFITIKIAVRPSSLEDFVELDFNIIKRKD